MDILSPSLILKAYRAGVFPMADDRDANEVYWVQPEIRGIFDIDTFHIPRSVRRMIKKYPYYVTINQDFEAVIQGCIQSRSEKRMQTWINTQIEDVFIQLHHQGYAHSFETRNSAGQLIGGLYGLSIGGAFFGESMFSLVSGASKFALIACNFYLKSRNFQLFDVQFVNEHLALFGCCEIQHSAYEAKLKKAIMCSASFLKPYPQSIINISDYI